MDPNSQRAIETRIATARAARAPVDSQGRPTGKPTTYTYDDDGLLIETRRAEQ